MGRWRAADAAQDAAIFTRYPAALFSVQLVLVHKSAVGRGSAAIAVYQAMRCDTGMPSRVIRLSAEQATRASVFWLGRVRARRPRPMMVLYRNTVVGCVALADEGRAAGRLRPA